ncbi:MAG: putative lipid II flippase FtsW [Rhodospirillaceae bacterium]|jgi:cell division protein FtsW|nr:putative lipid II flippase FtsW [Rhodospirillaceae bacterium]MBT5565229.1 putative lipid II flippase FtsW [Rhodospirillaceae bacterium]MBT6091087.1 putative lipid II flippase FtsW [Rhodospirillaceae bacterium]MBT6961315.1 putative lipid II flippase FtsW [Rhodospirillaceae bacterium]
MSSAFTRSDTSVVGRWWWTVDRWLLVSAGTLILIGMILTLAAGPPAAERIGADTYHFVRKQSVFLPIAIAVMLGISLMPALWIRRVAVVGMFAAFMMMFATLVLGAEINGAQRWLRLGGLSIQPSEFIKPFFVVVSAWLFSLSRTTEGVPGNTIALGCLMMVCAVLLSQPDVGMTMVVVSVWCAQFFMAGLPIFWVVLIAFAGLGALVGAYFMFPHVASRVDRFLDPASGDTYQVTQAIRAFQNGGMFGRGPGEGRVKETLPDAHTDFIFAVAGEEFGVLLCLVVVALFGFLVLRAMIKVLREDNLFILLAVGGLAVQFGLQSIINMASSLHMMPTKGMTLPFISYGGSSMLALAIGMGMILGLTRRRRDTEGLRA